MTSRREKILISLAVAAALAMLLVLGPRMYLAMFPARKITAEQLAFLDHQEKPFLLNDMTRQLGDTEIGNGPHYDYRIAGTKKRIEFWFGPSPDPFPENVGKEGVPAEILVVVEAAPDSKPRFLWPGHIRGLDVSSTWNSVYPKWR